MKPLVTLEDVERRLGEIVFPPVDAVVAIERGGRVPGELIAAITANGSHSPPNATMPGHDGLALRPGGT